MRDESNDRIFDAVFFTHLGPIEDAKLLGNSMAKLSCFQF